MYTFDDYTADEDWLPILSGEHSRLAGMTLTWRTDLFRQGAETAMRGRAIFFIALVVFLGRAGRVWGVDGYLAMCWPKSPLW